LQKSLCLPVIVVPAGWASEPAAGPDALAKEGLPVRMRLLLCVMGLAAGLAACSREPDYTPEQRSCIAQHYANYDARQLNQCVDICRLCMKGNVLTCNTSCRLRGAS
jgi:hypothetical protein